MNLKRTRFSSQRDGFRFANAFETRRFLPAALRGRASRQGVMGLCGGMCYTALDYQRVGQPTPDFRSVEGLSSPLLTYLLRRQVQSMQPLMLLRLADWLVRDDDYVGRKTCEQELGRVRRLVDAGQPAVLCLVRTRGLGDPTGNHQVIATGYDASLPGWVRLFLYDPNHPGQEPSLLLPAQWTGGEAMQQSTGEPLRGFFVMAYRPSRPPVGEQRVTA